MKVVTLAATIAAVCAVAGAAAVLAAAVAEARSGGAGREGDGRGAGAGPTVRDVLGPAAVVPLPAGGEAPARLVIDPPLAGSLAEGRVVLQYRAENLRIVPVFGAAALDVSPRIGHVHVTVDDGPWRWVDSSGEPLIINKLPAGPHKVLLELVDANHRTLDRGVVRFVVPPPSAAPPVTAVPPSNQKETSR